MKWLFIIVNFALIFAPLWQMKYAFVAERRLMGVESKESFPKTSFSSFWKGEYQEGLERWFSENIGFRNALVRTDNQLNYSVFGTVSSSYRSPMVVGKDNYLYERLYIDSLNAEPRIPMAKLREIASSLELLQQRLKNRKIGFLVLLSPSKAATYPEFIPKAQRKWEKNVSRDYDNFVALLEEREVNYFDGPALVRRLKSESKYPVFSKGGTHWSGFASCYVASGIIKSLENILGRSFININCEPVLERTTAAPYDKDLALLLNIWSLKPFSEQRLGYPQSSGVKLQSSTRPNVVIVGDSFLWTVLNYFDKHRIFKNRAFYYYFKTNYSYPKGVKVPIDREALDWENYVFSKDAIIVEINEAAIEQIGFGFIEDALERL